MANVFIFTVNDEPAGRRFSMTIQNGYDMGQLLSHIQDESHRDALEQMYAGGKCYLWGEAEESGKTRSEWEIMCEGDLALGYSENAIISVSRVMYKMDDPALADHLWGKDDGTSFRLIFFMTMPHLCNVEIVPRMLTYLDPPYDNLSRVGPDKLRNILTHYISLEDFARLLFGEDFPTSLRHSL
ncbi:MAG: hypothetical protein JXR85_05275 [Deltaproteobacteria bacterium]|nr:hypothetical protein [Deltaproteobacteria bacterium]